MSIEFRRGRQRIQWDGTKLFGTAPVVLPPPETARSGVPDPEDWAERLLDLLDPKTSVCLVVPDATRVGAWQSILPTLLQIVPSATAGRCTLLVATGTHRPATRPDLASHLLGPDGDRSLLDPWNVHQNSEEQFATHRRIGATPNGIEVRLHPLYLDSEIRILLGELSYHYFAGIGGGPKLVFPGLGEPVAAGRNHRRAVVGSELHPNCYPGNIRENPVHTDILAAVDLAPPNWVVSVQYPIQITQGPYPEAFFNAVDRFDTEEGSTAPGSPT